MNDLKDLTSDKKFITTWAYKKRSLNDRQKWRDQIALLRIEHAMDTKTFTCSRCKEEKPIKELSLAQIKLMQMRYDKIRPSLQSIDSVIHSYEDSADPNEIARQVAGILVSNPTLLLDVLKLDNAARQSVIGVVRELEHTTDNVVIDSIS